MATTKNPLTRGLRGKIGDLVFRHINKLTVVSQYPDMSLVKRSELQLLKQDIFKGAVKYAQSIMRNPIEKAAYQKMIGRKKKVYPAAISEYMKKNYRVGRP